MKINELIEQLEKATEPDRELDDLIFVKIGCAKTDPLPYTSSIDAAMTLVPEDWCWVGYSNYNKEFDFRVSQYAGMEDFMGFGPTAAIALCIAALKALEANLTNPNR